MAGDRRGRALGQAAPKAGTMSARSGHRRHGHEAPTAAMAAGQHVQQRHGEGSGAVGKAAQDKGGGDDGASTGLIWMTVREWPAVMELKQQRRSWQRQRLCVGLERAGEGRGNERQRVEKSVPVLY